MENSESKTSVRSWWRTRSRKRTIALWAVALSVLVLGFADLARGGVTIAPFLLVFGYCVLVPMAILS